MKVNCTLFTDNQRLMHPEWYWCTQGRLINLSPLVYAMQHITHLDYNNHLNDFHILALYFEVLKVATLTSNALDFSQLADENTILTFYL